MGGELTINKGDILVYYAFELAESINIDQVPRLLKPEGRESDIGVKRSKSYYVRFEKYPILMELGREELDLLGMRKVRVLARLFDYGVASIVFEIPCQIDLTGLIHLSQYISKTEPLYNLAFKYLDKVKEITKPALSGPIESALVEEYTVFYINQFNKSLTGEELIKRHGNPIARILRAEVEDLSEAVIKETLTESISYYSTELVVIDWDRALVYDQREYRDHLDIIEFANTQLLDIRYYDSWVDRELERIYAEIEKGRAGVRLFGARYRRMMSRLITFTADVLWSTERIENSFRGIETLFTAKVHQAVSKVFHLDSWRRGLSRKLDFLNNMNALMSSEVHSRHNTILELIIVILILAEIILLFFI